MARQRRGPEHLTSSIRRVMRDELSRSPARKRAEQILEALQGQEQQVFRMQNNGERRRGRAQQVMERDW